MLSATPRRHTRSPPSPSTATYQGNITPAGVSTVNLNADATFQIKPTTGYHIVTVYADGVAVGNPSSYTFHNVVANHTLTAKISINTFKISPYRNNSHGTITPSSVQTVNYGWDSATFNIKASSGHKVTRVDIDGIPQPIKSSYRFYSVKAKHSIKAYFN
jgi:hypothetical protein